MIKKCIKHWWIRDGKRWRCSTCGELKKKWF